LVPPEKCQCFNGNAADFALSRKSSAEFAATDKDDISTVLEFEPVKDAESLTPKGANNGIADKSAKAGFIERAVAKTPR
jgi:hypothetical protein